jgi:putative membrane protein
MKLQHFKILPVSLLAIATFTQACTSNQSKSTADSSATMSHSIAHDSAREDTTDNMKNGTPVNRFLEEAAVSGMVEVEMGKIGQQKASLKSIKDFAAMIVKDHTEVNGELKTLAAAKGFSLPAELTHLKKEHLKDLQRAMGRDFDNYYINMMVEDHISDISLFEGAAKSPDTAVSAFAMKVLPLLQKHYKEARQISNLFDQNIPKK